MAPSRFSLSAEPPAVPKLRRTKPERITYTSFNITNIVEGEVVHQACLLVQGVCHSFENSGDDFITAAVVDCFDVKSPAQHWPVDQGHWKALVMLSPGRNRVSLELIHAEGICDTVSVSMDYVPLLQLPPLHLAILVARDSPLRIDCPPAKWGAVSSTHSTLDAAITKFRMTAYMWQALTAADAHSKGLGRRSFRLDEQWGQSTITQPRPNATLGSYAKVHIVRTKMTLTQLRDAQLAQENPRAQRPDELHRIFENALKLYGGPFEATTRPVVAGLILDSAFSIDKDMVLAHAASGCHKADGISLGIFGSHLTYAWPRFMEEVPACLLDKSPVGESVSNDNGECNTFQAACQFSQGAFLHEVGHAFGAKHTSGIMERGSSKDWWRAFLGHPDPVQDASWDLQDMLSFMSLPHFLLPHEQLPSKNLLDAEISVSFDCTQADGDDIDHLKISCAAGLARVQFINANTSTIVKQHSFSVTDLRPTLTVVSDMTELRMHDKLKLCVLARNGKTKDVLNIWRLLANKAYVRVPNHPWRLNKQFAGMHSSRDVRRQERWDWTNLLYKKDAAGHIARAIALDLRVGATMDGAVLYYGDGSVANCGPNYNQQGQVRMFGGGSQCHRIPAEAEIVKVELNTCVSSWSGIDGIRITLDNGLIWGELNDRFRSGAVTVTLTPPNDERIVGFFGTHDGYHGYTSEFGIITAPKAVEVLPDEVFEMDQLRNTDGGLPKVEGAQMPSMEICRLRYGKLFEDVADTKAEVAHAGGSVDPEASEDSEDYDDWASEHTID